MGTDIKVYYLIRQLDVYQKLKKQFPKTKHEELVEMQKRLLKSTI